MTRREKALFRLAIIEADKQNRFELEKSFFELDMYDINKLDKYAEIFGIKGYNGASRARTLWYQIKKANETRPF